MCCCLLFFHDAAPAASTDEFRLLVPLKGTTHETRTRERSDRNLLNKSHKTFEGQKTGWVGARIRLRLWTTVTWLLLLLFSQPFEQRNGETHG